MEIYTTTNEPFWVTPSIYMDNTDTLYLGEQHCLVRNCWFFFLFVFPSVPVCQLLVNIDGSFIYIYKYWISIQGYRAPYHWVAPRSSQPFIFSRSIKWAPEISENLVVKCKLLLFSSSVALTQFSPIHTQWA